MAKSKEIDIITKLEDLVEKKIPRLNLEDILGIRNGYALDDEGNVGGLNLSESNLADISFISALPELTHLDLSANKITDISPLKRLTALNALILENNHITNISPLKNLKDLIYLRLSNNRITDISPLKNLIDLIYLRLSGNQIKDIGGLKNLDVLIYLRIANNRIRDISPLKYLVGLTYLRLSGNQVEDISPLGQLGGLNTLSLGDNQVSDISVFEELTGLNELIIRGNNIEDIGVLEQLTALTKLDLSNNRVTELLPLADLTALGELALGENRISDISVLKNLTGLSKLDVSYNRVTDVSSLTDLRFLNSLSLEGNQVEDISPLRGLIGLNTLLLGKNHVEDINALKNLAALNELDLTENRVNDITVLTQLKNLKKLDLTHNQLSLLPPEILHMGMEVKWEYDLFEDGIFLEGNPLEIPPSDVVQQGSEAIRAYFQEKAQDFVLLMETRLLVVGNGGAGKSSLIRQLHRQFAGDGEPVEGPVYGVNTVSWKLPCDIDGHNNNVKVHCWDFGDQESVGDTFRFFLGERCLYLLVWEARARDHRDPLYWLHTIRRAGKGSPVLVVMNKADMQGHHLDEQNLKKQFPQIKAFLRVSSEKGEGMRELAGQIRRHLGQMPHLRDKMPKAWLQLRDRLQKEKKNYLSLQDYYVICHEYGLNEERAEFFSAYLHDIGALGHYRGHRLMENTLFLNPNWAVEAVHQLMSNRKIRGDKGYFFFRDLKDYWDPSRFPPFKHSPLIGLMEQFDLCIPVSATGGHLLPRLLPRNRPTFNIEKYRAPDCPHFRQQYEFMPESILHRFIAGTQHLMVDGRYWAGGVELHFGDATALVTADFNKRCLEIYAAGNAAKELLAIARSHLELIHRVLEIPTTPKTHPDQPHNKNNQPPAPPPGEADFGPDPREALPEELLEIT